MPSPAKRRVNLSSPNLRLVIDRSAEMAKPGAARNAVIDQALRDMMAVACSLPVPQNLVAVVERLDNGEQLRNVGDPRGDRR